MNNIELKSAKKKSIGELIAIAMLFCFTQDAASKNIITVGNSRISDATIISYSKITTDSISESELDDAIKSLFNTGFFSDVRIKVKDDDIIIEVKENPLINKIGFDGNDKINSEDLEKEVMSKPNTILSSSKMQKDIKRLDGLYKKMGKYSARIEPKIIKLDNERVNIVFEIEEGNSAVIRKINFSGNKSFRDVELASALLSKEYRFYRFFSNVDLYDPDKLEFDKELLIKFYENKGYAAFKMHSLISELSRDKEGFLITFSFTEGDLYKFGVFDFSSDISDFDPENLRKFITIKSEDVFNRQVLDDIIESMTKYLGDNGYPFSEIDVKIATDKSSLLANVTFNISQSNKMYIRNINIKNNTRTLDKVIRREFRVSEGDPYNITKMQRSEQRLRNLDFFNNIEIKNVRTPYKDQLDVDVFVEEKSTGSINFAGGYNSASGMLGQISLSERNFLGKGQYVNVAGSLGQKEKNFKFSFTEPYFLDKDISAGFDVFKSKHDMQSVSSYSSLVSGLMIRSSYDLSEYLSHSLRYFYKNENIKDVSDKASIYVKEQEGKHKISAIGHSFAYDRLDAAIDPTSGYHLLAEQDIAGLGGNTKYISHKLTGVFFHPIYKKDVVFKATSRFGNITGYGGKKVALNDRFFIGPDYMRGFDIGGIGPRSNSSQSDALGGKTYYTLSLDVLFPIGLPNEIGLKGVIFHDIGSLYGVDIKDKAVKANILHKRNLRASVGIGLIWKAPIGTISMYYGNPYKKEKFDDIKRFYFDFGTGF